MRQAADILASPAAMQIRQLEAFQQMAKTSNSKVIFVPMALNTDVGQLATANAEGGGEAGTSLVGGVSSGAGGSSGGGAAIQSAPYSAAVINSLTQV